MQDVEFHGRIKQRNQRYNSSGVKFTKDFLGLRIGFLRVLFDSETRLNCQLSDCFQYRNY